MGWRKRFILVIFLIIASIVLLFLFRTKPISTQSLAVPSPTTSQEGKIVYPQDFTIVLLGDSMTEVLGNSDELRSYLKEYYPDKSFEVLNYGFGSTNILSVSDRLQKETFHKRAFRPILDIDFDLILIESFGHNPLSEYKNMEDGIKKQTETLDLIVKLIKEENPKAKIVFVATIAPNKPRYGLGGVDLSTQERIKWANEREAYIKNHISYANSHNIPLINIYQKSLNDDGNGQEKFISPADNIHPSPSGVYFISQEIADFIFYNKLLK